MERDLSQARAFIEKLTGDENTPCTWQVIPESKHAECKPEVIHGSLSELGLKLEYLNEKGAGIFVTINETDLKGRKKENVKSIRAVFVDADNVELAQTPLNPSIIIQSKRGKHAYWTIKNENDLFRFEETQKILIEKLGTDPSIKDPSRVMRVPGFFHVKGDPFLVTIEKLNGTGPYTLDEIAWQFGKKIGVKTQPKAKARSKIKNSKRLERYVQKALEYECDEIRNASVGNRNNTINKSAFKIGTLVGAELVSEKSAREYLNKACMECEARSAPLDKKDFGAIENGLCKGKKNPRPDPNPEPELGNYFYGNAVPESTEIDIEYEIEQQKNDLHVAGDDEKDTVLKHFKKAPINEKHYVPFGYCLLDETVGGISIYKVIKKNKESIHIPVSYKPIVITDWIHNVTTETRMLKIAWKANGKWRNLITDRQTVKDGSKILSLANLGFPVDASNKTEIIKYLSAYENANIQSMGCQEITSQMGWQADGGFVIGDDSINTDISFNVNDESNNQIKKALAISGSFEEWKKILDILKKYPGAMVGLYGSLVPPMLELFSVSNFFLDFAHKTSSGKTTTLRIGASVWGNPNEHAKNNLIRGWNATQVSIERTASILFDLPVFIDDTKLAKRFGNQSIVPQIIYMVTDGHGKSRGSLNGMQKTLHFRTVAITSGEHSIVDESQDGGTRPRVLSIWGSPFKEESDEVANDIKEINKIISKNHGHAGRKFIEYIIENKEKMLSTWIERFDKIYPENKNNDSVSIRVSNYFSIILLVGELFNKCIGFEFDLTKISDIFKNLSSQISGDADKAQEAYDFIMERIASMNSSINRNDNKYQPSNGWIGVEETGGQFFFKNWVYNELESKGFHPKSIIKQWAERNLIEKDADGKSTILKWYNDKNIRVINFTQKEMCAVK